MEVIVWKVHRFPMGRCSSHVWWAGRQLQFFRVAMAMVYPNGQLILAQEYAPVTSHIYDTSICGPCPREMLVDGQIAATQRMRLIWEPANKMTIHVRLVNDGKFPQIQWVFKEYSNLSWVWISCPHMNWIPDFLDGGSFTVVLLEMAYDSNLFTPTNAWWNLRWILSPLGSFD